MEDYRVLLYYKYVHIEDPEQFKDDHLKFCKELGLKGRILVSAEGLNGTVSGTVKQTDAYMEKIHADSRFEDMLFKIDKADDHAFKKMHVRYRPEIVSLQLGDENHDASELTGEFLEPQDFKNALLDENTIVLDARNDYEYDLGHFRGAVRPEIRNFRELPQWIKDNKENFLDKKVLTYCTGGIRCEKLTGWLMKEGIDVAQLHGGIHQYGADPEVQGEYWDGSMYVFDERISVPINKKEPVIVGKDWFDGSPCERYVNCGNPYCNRQMLCSSKNEHAYLRGCSHDCRVHPDNRYVKEHDLSIAEVAKRLDMIGESLPTSSQK
ncbi:rhodanese-related sulfurtransferase [Lacticigenium naphthae]|uniref:oxygen-dependent tRNA uridine(34) hydroxylase TrhO n=1 Tax=Lacticigenium naphthae TaxID=515351 RepID=UPI00040581E0|nr:rhodanese-related sulfurtransferase [Lacticigenium naphthae]